MGNCLATIHQTECRHERLNEHNDRYFERVQARNSTQVTYRQWFGRRSALWTMKPSDDSPQMLSNPTSTLLDDDIVLGVPLDESSPTSKGSSTTVSVGAPLNIQITTDLPHNLSTPQKKRSKRHRRVRSSDEAIDGWTVKRKGHALQMRLAANRLLQIAATVMEDTSSNIQFDQLSPLTMDSHSEVTATMSNTSTPASPSQEDTEWSSDFEQNGMVWLEMERRVPVTAVTFSREQFYDARSTSNESVDSKRKRRPLLMAVGDQNGNIVVSELLDEQRHPMSLKRINGQNSVTTSEAPLRKFGESLEVTIDGRIRSLDFSCDSNYLVAGGDGCVAVILLVVVDPATYSLRDLRILKQVERVDRIYSVQFNPCDGQSLAIAGFDGTVAIGSVDEILSTATNESNQVPLTEVAQPGLVYTFDWNPTGNKFAVGGSGKKCAIYDNKGVLIHEIARTTTIQTLKWNHDGSYLAVGDREVAILDGKEFQVKCEISNAPDSPSSAAAKYRIEAICWSPDGKFLAIGGSDGICLIVETKGYALVHEVHRQAEILCLAWGQRILNGEFGRYLAVSDANRTVALVKAGADVEGSETDETSSAASSSYWSATSSEWVLREDNFRDVDDAASAEIPHNIKREGSISAVAFSNEVNQKGVSYLAYAADDCSLTIMTTKDWKAVFQMEFAKPLKTLAFSYSGKFLALGGDEGVLYVLSVASRSIIFNTIFNSGIKTVAFSRQDERLAVGSNDGVLTLLCPDVDWEPVGELDYSESSILSQDWSTKTLAIGRVDGTVAVFDTDKSFGNFFVPLAEYSYSAPVRTLAFGANGQFLAVGGDSGMASVLSSKGGWVVLNQFKLGGVIMDTKWSPAGRYLALVGENILRIIDTLSWTEVRDVHSAVSSIFEGGTMKTIACVDWSADGKWVTFGSVGGGIYVIETSCWKLRFPLQNQPHVSESDDSPPLPGTPMSPVQKKI